MRQGSIGIEQHEMALNADGIDVGALALEIANEPDRLGELVGVFDAVVVVIELGVGIGGVGEFEGFGDVVVADGFEGSRVGRRYSSAVSLMASLTTSQPDDFSFEVGGDAVDVALQVFQRFFAGERISGVVLEHPGGGLVVPAEVVADDFHVVGFGECDELVCGGEVEFAWLGFEGVGLEFVFGGEAVELVGDEVGDFGAVELSGADAGADAGSAPLTAWRRVSAWGSAAAMLLLTGRSGEQPSANRATTARRTSDNLFFTISP